MKKLLIIIVLLSSVFLVACEKGDSSNITSNKMLHEHCTRSGVLDGGTADLQYDIYYTGDILNKIESYEAVSSEDSSLLDQYEEAYNTIHAYYKGLNYYITKVERTEGSIESTIIIDYDKINIDELISIEGEEDNIFENKVPKVSKWKELAKKVGTKCELVS